MKKSRSLIVLLEELLIIFPEHFNNGKQGLCTVVPIVTTTNKEFKLLYAYINRNRPKYWLNKSFGWKPRKINCRKRWLKKHIKLLKDAENKNRNNKRS